VILLKLATAYEWLKGKWWLGWLIVLLLAWLLAFRKPAAIETEKIVEKEVVKWRYTDRIVTGPDSKTTMKPDGTVTIDGTVSISRSGSGEAIKEKTTEKIVKVIETWQIIGGLGLSTEPSWPPTPAIDGMVGARIGKVLFLDIGAGLTARAPVTLTGIDRVGLMLFATF